MNQYSQQKVMSKIQRNDYNDLLKEVKTRITETQYQALKTVNKALVNLYWKIGELIIERQGEESWGKAIVEQLARDTKRFSSN